MLSDRKHLNTTDGMKRKDIVEYKGETNTKWTKEKGLIVEQSSGHFSS